MIKKMFLFVLVFAILFLVREAFMFYLSFKRGELDISKWRLLGIGLSISYIMTIIFTGFEI